MTTITKYDNTAIIVTELPGTYSEEDFWAIPSGSALRRLTEMLGEGSQVFLFLSLTFGDPEDRTHNYKWHEQFAAALKDAWGEETPPWIHFENGFDFKIHGGSLDGPETSERIFGTQTGPRPDYLGRPITPTPVRIFGGDYWYEPADGHLTEALCTVIISELGPHPDFGPKAIHFDSSAHCDARMNVWLQRSGAVSEVYRQVVHIEDWTEDGEPVIASVTDVWGG